MTRTEQQENVFASGWYAEYSEAELQQQDPVAPKAFLSDAEHKRRTLGELDHALHSAEKIHRSLRSATEYFYTGRESDAVKLLTQCLEGLARFLETISHTRPALHDEFESAATGGRTLSEVERDFIGILDALTERQEQLDFGGVVERVEDELLTNLSSWITLLRGICHTTG